MDGALFECQAWSEGRTSAQFLWILKTKPMGGILPKFTLSLSILTVGMLSLSPSASAAKASPQKAPVPVETSEPMDPIKYAGVWLSGKFSDIDKNFPVGKEFTLRRLESQGGGFQLSRQILEALRKGAKPGGRRLVNALAPDDYTPEAKAGKALVLACAINYEHVDSVRIGGVTKVMAEVGFDLVICDFTTRSVVVALPGRVMRTDVDSGVKASEQKKTQMLQFLYKEEVLKQFVKLAQNRGLEIMGLSAVGVTKVTFLDEAKKVLPEWMHEKSEDYIANVAGSNFYEGIGLPILPFSRGNELVFCSMQERLSDASEAAIKSNESGDGEHFTLKKPDYEVELVIPTFRTVTASSNAAGKLVQNCCYSRITVKKGEQIFYTAQHDGSVQNLVPKGSSDATPWLAYSDALNEMFYKGSKQIKSKLSGPRKKQDNPQLVIDPDALRNLFLDCAPWMLVGKQ